MEVNKPVYLGDGLYVNYDGYQVALMANSHSEPTAVVYLEPGTLEAFREYISAGEEQG